MAFPRIEVVVDADTKRAEAGLDRVENSLNEVGGASRRASRRVSDISSRLSATTSRGRNFGRAFQGVGFQINDFATQVGAGTSASIALGQQLPQLLQGFGLLGVAISVVVAAGLPLYRVLGDIEVKGGDLTRVFGTLEPMMKSVGASMTVVKEIAIDFGNVLFTNIDRIITIAATAAAFFAGKWVVGFVAARVATFSLVGALTALRGALIRTGFAAIIVGAGELVYQFTRLVSAAGNFGEAIALLRDVGVEAWAKLVAGGKGLVASLNAGWLSMEQNFLTAISHMLGSLSDFFLSAQNGFEDIPGFGLVASGFGNAAASLGKSAGQVSRAAWDVHDRQQAAQSAANDLLGTAGGPFESIQKIRDLLASMKDEGLTLPDILGSPRGEDDDGGSDKKTLKEKLSEKEQAIRDHLSRIKALTVGTLGEKLGAWGNYFQSLGQLMGSGGKKLLAIAKSFSAARALINAWEAYTDVLRSPTLPWYAKIAAAGNVLAAGIGAVNAIKSVSAGGGGGSAGAAATGTTQPAQAAQPGQNIVIDARGDFFSRNTFTSLVDQINEEIQRGARINGISVR